MAPRRNSNWFYAFQDDDEWVLMCGHGLQNIVQGLSNPKRQHPSIVLMAGRGEKSIAHKAMFSQIDQSKSRGRGMAQLNVVPSTAASDNPVLIADVDLDNAYRGHCPPRDHTRQRRCRVEWTDNTTPSDVVDAVFSRLLLLFVDVVCLFLDDFMTTEDALNHLQRWTKSGANFSKPWKPRVILVTKRSLAIPDMPFSEIRHLILPSRKSSLAARYRGLRDAIFRQVSLARKARATYHMLFSATHLNVLFDAALQHTAKTILDEFNFITATRQYNNIDEQFVYHLENFLHLCTEVQASKEFILHYIASAILMDSLPPEMHRFDSHVMFEHLYSALCYQAILAHSGDRCISPDDWCRQLRSNYSRMYLELDATNTTSLQNHKRTLQSISTDWSKFHTSKTCLFCLRRKPEHVFECRHAFCDICACLFGEKLAEREYFYLVSTCIVCQCSGALRVYLKPPTAGPRLLTLDGGGVRGIFTLQVIEALDQYRGLPYPIYDEFDLALGTSTGGLIVLMFLLRRSIQEYVATFNKLARQVFSPRSRLQGSFPARIYSFVLLLATDSLYGARKMEACVREAYGADNLLFGSSGLSVSGAKIAVTTMTVSNTRLCILSNYNGGRERRKESSYTHFRPSMVGDEPFIHEAARATSAAPSYFPAKFIRGFGFAQDGGAGKHNNPINPVEWESKAIWDTVPDIVVSIGTGFEQPPGNPLIVSERLGFCDRFLLRLSRLFGAALNAQGNWNDHQDGVDENERSKFFRINMPLDREPELDDADKIPEIQKWTSSFLATHDFLGVTQALFSSSFFFELHQKPVFVGNTYLCSGSIRCRSPNSRALVLRILHEYPTASFLAEDGIRLGQIDNHNLCVTCGKYCKKVTFTVCHPNQSISIFLEFNRLWSHRISGFPQKMSSFVKNQMLDATFGRPDHRTIEYAVERCECTVAKKRKRELPAPKKQPPTQSSVHKRRRR